MKFGKPFMNYKNDLDECLTYFKLLFLTYPIFLILFSRLPNLLSHFNQLLSKKVPKLLESYDNSFPLDGYKIYQNTRFSNPYS
jgi:hypothetical protein